MKSSKKAISIILSIVMVIGCIVFAEPQVTEASTKKVATAYDGDWTYFSYLGIVYKLNSKNGKLNRVTDLSYHPSGMKYYDEYIYFSLDVSSDVMSSESFIYRMKADGTNRKKLCRGHSLKIFDNKIYFVKTKNYIDKFDNTKYDKDYNEPIN